MEVEEEGGLRFNVLICCVVEASKWKGLVDICFHLPEVQERTLNWKHKLSNHHTEP